jgi:hypothetical protein
MSFWEEVFPEAMNQLNQDPLPYRGPYQPQWGIRHLTVWRDVQAKLDMARQDYEFDIGQQQVGKFRRGMRRAMDKAGAPLQLGRKLIPLMDITSPVLGVVDLLLDVSTRAEWHPTSNERDSPRTRHINRQPRSAKRSTPDLTTSRTVSRGSTSTSSRILRTKTS